jgi:sulfate adenylyltransferase subunit 1 (EFTu-like GTPase family)
MIQALLGDIATQFSPVARATGALVLIDEATNQTVAAGLVR